MVPRKRPWLVPHGEQAHRIDKLARRAVGLAAVKHEPMQSWSAVTNDRFQFCKKPGNP